jgi:formate-dependent nitrite reductase membrane component NrfD
MEPIILFQQKWGLTFHIPWYLFLGGLAGGTMTVAALTDLLAGSRQGLRNFSRAAAYVTVPAIIIGGLSLTFHLGKPERGLAFPLFFTNYQSWMTIGGWILGAFAPLSIVYAAAWYFNVSRALRAVLAVLAVPLGLLMSLYTGFLLCATWVVPGDRWYVPLWDSRYLPVLFVLSGISTGIAAAGLWALIAGRFSKDSAGSRAAEQGWGAAEVASLADVGAIVVEGAWVYVFLASFGVGTLGQQMAFKLMTGGELAPWFWWGFVATGLALPLLASGLHSLGERIFHARLGWVFYVKFILVLVGGLMLRYVIVWGGDLKTPLIFPPSMWPVPGIGGPPIPGLGG